MSNEEQTGTTPENWIEETAYIMREMFHAMRQSVVMTNDDEEWDMSWFKRALELREKAESCVQNSFNYVIEHSDLLFVDDNVTGDTTDDAQQTVENDEDE